MRLQVDAGKSDLAPTAMVVNGEIDKLFVTGCTNTLGYKSGFEHSVSAVARYPVYTLSCFDEAPRQKHCASLGLRETRFDNRPMFVIVTRKEVIMQLFVKAGGYTK